MSERDNDIGSPRYCTKCGVLVSQEDVFCGSCGTQLSQNRAAPVRASGNAEGIRHRVLPAGSGKDALLGLFLAAGVAAATVILIYLLLFSYELFGGQHIPYSLGVVLYALMHGGAVFLEMPPTQALFGIGGVIAIGTSYLLFRPVPLPGSTTWG